MRRQDLPDLIYGMTTNISLLTDQMTRTNEDVKSIKKDVEEIKSDLGDLKELVQG